MTRIHHLNCGWLHKPPLPPACCHCLLVESSGGCVLIDTGIGLADIAAPELRLGKDIIAAAGFQFIPELTAVRQLESLGIQRSDVTDIVLTHGDSDHVGGLADFPAARVHLALEEKANLESGNPRYTLQQLDHGPLWQTYDVDDCETLGVPSRRVTTSLQADIRLVPLFGHTLGHCGVAVESDGGWILHVGDAYYLRDELSNRQHPIDQLAALRADDNELRKQSLELIRNLTQLTGEKLTVCGYHDVQELPAQEMGWITTNYW